MEEISAELPGFSLLASRPAENVGARRLPNNPLRRVINITDNPLPSSDNNSRAEAAQSCRSDYFDFLRSPPFLHMKARHPALARIIHLSLIIYV